MTAPTVSNRPGVNPAPARLHLLRLRAADMSSADIAASANVTKQTVDGILRGARCWLQAKPAARILAVPTPTTDGPACRTDPELAYDDAQAAEAKRLCLRCPVRGMCRDTAMQAVEPWGVWGGLTPVERERHRAGAAVVPCTGCGLDCVPANGDRCGDCDPPAPPANLPPGMGLYEHRDLITSLSLDSWTVPDIATLIGCNPESVVRAQKRWGLPRTMAARGPRTGLKPCGTPAAIRRHYRRREECPVCRTAENRRMQDTWDLRRGRQNELRAARRRAEAQSKKSAA